MVKRRTRWTNPPLAQRRARRLGVHFGVNARTEDEVRVSLDRFSTGVHVLGPPGIGKSRLLLWLFQVFCRVPNASVILLNPKGDLARLGRDWAVTHGFTNRLVWFSPGEEPVLGWNPLAPNTLPVATHAKAVRERLLAGWGQQDLDETPQLARFLFLALAVAREAALTLTEALAVLEPDSPIRGVLLPGVRDPLLRELLSRLDARYRDPRRAARQEEQVASAVARLESFVADEVIRSILTRQGDSVDLGSIVHGNKIFIANLEMYKPLRPADVKLLGRMLVNDILAHVFARPATQRSPVFLMLDEVHILSTLDLCVALELGRELGLKTVIAHQFPQQLVHEGGDRLLAAVNACARTKVVFGGMTAENLESLVRELTIDQFDDTEVKDELTSLEVEPVNRWHLQVAETENWSKGVDQTRGTADTKTESEAHDWSYQDSVTDTEGSSTAVSAAKSPNGDETSTVARQEHEARAVGRTTGARDGWSTSEAHTDNQSTAIRSAKGGSVTRTWVQITDVVKRRVVSSRTFLTEAEFLTRKLKELKELPQAHFVLKVSGHAALTVRAPYVRTPSAGPRRLTESLARVYEAPYYATLEEVARSEARRVAGLLAAAEPTIVSHPTGRRRTGRK